jgi:DNA-binding NarL/FixJ family response regulator
MGMRDTFLEHSLGPIAAPRPTRIWIASRNVGTRGALVARLGSVPQLRVTGTCAKDIDCLAECLLGARPDVLLFDGDSFPKCDLAAVQQFCTRMSDLRVLLLVESVASDLADEVIRHRLHGYLHSNSPTDICMRAIDTVTRGELWMPRAVLAKALALAWDRLAQHERMRGGADAPANGMDSCTERERQILELVRLGHTNKHIAQQLGIMEDTVKKHLQHVYDKLGVRRRTLLMLGEGRGHLAS